MEIIHYLNGKEARLSFLQSLSSNLSEIPSKETIQGKRAVEIASKIDTPNQNEFTNCFHVGDIIEFPSLDEFDDCCIVQRSLKNESQEECQFGVVCACYSSVCQFETKYKGMVMPFSFLRPNFRVYNFKREPYPTSDDVCWHREKIPNESLDASSIAANICGSAYQIMRSFAGKTIYILASRYVSVMGELSPYHIFSSNQYQVMREGNFFRKIYKRKTYSLLLIEKEHLAEEGLKIKYHNNEICGAYDNQSLVLNKGIEVFDGSFAENEDMISRLYLPSSVKFIDIDSLSKFKCLEEINIDTENPYFYSLDGVLLNKDKTELLYVPRKNNHEHFTIPEGVSSIGKNAFAGCEVVSSVDFPISIVEICDRAFEGCPKLQFIDIPPMVNSIGKSAFANCKSLISIDLPDNVKIIGSSAFSGCEALKTLRIPKGISVLEEGTFENSGLVKIMIPLNVVYIKKEAFFNCTQLKSVVISKGVKKILDSSFENCSFLETISFMDGVMFIGDKAFKGCSHLKELLLPDSINHIGKSAFCNCRRLNKIILSTQLKRLESKLFSGCNSLVDLKLPQHLEEIRDFVFQECSSLEKIELPDSIRAIGEYAFADCGSIETIIIPNKVEILKNGTFSNCHQLSEVILGDNLKVISWNTFDFCTSMKRIVIPKSVEKVEPAAFQGCELLEEIIVSEDNPYLSVVDGILYSIEEDRVNLVCFPSGVYVPIYKTPDNVCEIGEASVIHNDKIQHIIISGNVSSVKDHAFCVCSSLKRVDFDGCVKKIGKDLFRDSFCICEIHINVDNPSELQISDNAFISINKIKKGNKKACTLFVPAGSRWLYRHHPIFSEFENIEVEPKETV